MKMRILLSLVAMLGFSAFASAGGTGCQPSTRESVHDDREGPERSGPYASDVKEVTAKVINQLKKEKVLDAFRNKYKEPPIVALIRPKNETRFVEVVDFFQEDMLTALMENFNREQIRFSTRDSDVQESIGTEKEAKEAGERTDRTGRKTKLGADYFLRARFSAISVTDGREEEDTVKYSYELIDTETDELIFKGAMDIRRVAGASAVYR
jgi:hypothetical protein